MSSWRYEHCSLKLTPLTLIFTTLLMEVDSRYRPCLNNTEELCDHPEESWKLPSDVWEAVVLAFGILLFVVCGGAVILRWICDFMHKFKSCQSRCNTNRRQPSTSPSSCTSPAQSWYPGDLPPPYYEEAPGYDEVILNDILSSRLPLEPPPYCFELPPGFEPPDVDEHDDNNNDTQMINEVQDELPFQGNVSIISESFEVTEASIGGRSETDVMQDVSLNPTEDRHDHDRRWQRVDVSSSVFYQQTLTNVMHPLKETYTA